MVCQNGVQRLIINPLLMILFSSVQETSIQMMHVLRRYEDISGQRINKSKSFFYLHEKTSLIYTIRVRKLTGIGQGDFPFVYLLSCLPWEKQMLLF